MSKSKLQRLKEKLRSLEIKREDRVDRYIIPIEIEMDRIKELIEKENSHELPNS